MSLIKVKQIEAITGYNIFGDNPAVLSTLDTYITQSSDVEAESLTIPLRYKIAPKTYVLVEINNDFLHDNYGQTDSKGVYNYIWNTKQVIIQLFNSTSAGKLLYKLKAGWRITVKYFYLKPAAMPYTFGDNFTGGLGIGNKDPVNGAIQEPTVFPEFKEITMGDATAYFLGLDLRVCSLGSNYAGALGMGNYDSPDGQLQLTNFVGVKKVVAAGNTTYILYYDGTAKCFGYNGSGILFTGNDTSNGGAIRTLPYNVVDIVAAPSHTFLFLVDGSIICTGVNGTGELGLGTHDWYPYKFEIHTSPLTNVKRIICADKVTFIQFNDLTWKSCGNNSSGKLGLGYASEEFDDTLRTPIVTNIKDIILGAVTYFLLNDGTMKSCGPNTTGLLGMGNTTDYNGAICTPPISGIKEIHTLKRVTILLLDDGTLRAFGDNTYYGQLGMGNTTDYNGAICTPPFVDVEKVFVAGDFVYIWGTKI